MHNRMLVEEFAEFADVKPQTVRRKCARGDYVAVKFGSRWVIFVDETLEKLSGGAICHASSL